MEEDVAPRLARRAAIVEPEPAVDAVIGDDVAGRHEGTLTTGADVGRHLLQGVFRAERLTAFGFGLLLDAPTLRQISPHGPDDVMRGDRRQHDADAVAH